MGVYPCKNTSICTLCALYVSYTSIKKYCETESYVYGTTDYNKNVEDRALTLEEIQN